MTLPLHRGLIALTASLVVGCSMAPNEGSGLKPSPSRPAEARSLGDGRAEFQKVGEPAESFQIEIITSGPHKGSMWGSGEGAVFFVEWSDGYTSGYDLMPSGEGLVFDFNQKNNSWSDGTKLQWAISGDDVVLTSATGTVTRLGGTSQMVKGALNELKQQQEAEALALRERQAEAERQQEEELAQQRMYTDMDLARLDREFKENRIRARRNYEDKVITLRGYIDAIYDDKLTVCQKQDSNCISLPYGGLNEGLENWLAERDQGDAVTVTGVIEISAFAGQQTSSMKRWRIRNGHSDSPLALD